MVESCFVLFTMYYLYNNKKYKKNNDIYKFLIAFKSHSTRVSSEWNFSRKNVNIFVCISQTFSRILATFRENEFCEKMRKQCFYLRNYFLFSLKILRETTLAYCSLHIIYMMYKTELAYCSLHIIYMMYKLS